MFSLFNSDNELMYFGYFSTKIRPCNYFNKAFMGAQTFSGNFGINMTFIEGINTEPGRS